MPPAANKQDDLEVSGFLQYWLFGSVHDTLFALQRFPPTEVTMEQRHAELGDAAVWMVQPEFLEPSERNMVQAQFAALPLVAIKLKINSEASTSEKWAWTKFVNMSKKLIIDIDW